LAVQDTTSLNYNSQTKMDGIGYICEQTMGVNIGNLYLPKIELPDFVFRNS